jgi:hypothetical protein
VDPFRGKAGGFNLLRGSRQFGFFAFALSRLFNPPIQGGKSLEQFGQLELHPPNFPPEWPKGSPDFMLGQPLDFRFDCRFNFSQINLLCIIDDFEQYLRSPNN